MADPIAESRVRTVGSGIVLADAGPVLTNAHVVEACSILRLVLPSGTRIPARVIRLDPTDDLALLSAPLSGGLTLDLRAAPTAHEEIWYSGFPNAVSLLQTYTGRAGVSVSKADTFPIEGPVRPGDSGGPVFDTAGNLVGMTYAGQTGGLAMKGWKIAAFLDESGVRLPPATSTEPLPEEHLLARTSMITIRIECDQLGRPAATWMDR